MVRETHVGETRVALVPALVPRILALGHSVTVEPGAGEAAGYLDHEYAAAGAVIGQGPAELVLSVHPVSGPGSNVSLFAGEAGYALERLPRISRAQSMDALTSQSLVAGYRGAVVAAELLRSFFPPAVTAAGSLPPAQVVVLGAGVAGLQAIATCKRLGAVVRAYDVRASSAEEIRSLGAEAIDLGLPPLEGAAGYARTLSPERARQQQLLLTPYVEAADALITTAAVPGRQAPLLATAAMVARMRPGSVVVDLAADAGGNVEDGPGLEHVTIWREPNVAAQLPGPASWLYANNVVSFLEHLAKADPDDEILVATSGGRAG